MSFDPVPWFVEGGAQHSAEVARLLCYFATGGREGVLNSTDMRVLAQSVPGTTVRVMPGACVIRNRSLGGENQSYVARIATEDGTIAIPAAGSGGPRTHLVVARVENPFISGEPWGPAPDLESGPYIYPRVIPDVPIATVSVHDLALGYTAINLARITVPTSTATITQAMITDLRGLANPATGPQPPDTGTGGGDGDCDEQDPVIVCPGGGGDDGDNDTGDPLTSTDTTYINWPFNAAWNLAIPAWATHADITIEVQNAQIRHGSIGGFIRLLLAGIAQAEQSWKCDWPGATSRQHIPITYSNLAIPSSIRGTTIQWRLQGRCGSGFTGRVLATPSTRVKVTVKFKQRPS